MSKSITQAIRDAKSQVDLSRYSTNSPTSQNWMLATYDVEYQAWREDILTWWEARDRYRSEVVARALIALGHPAYRVEIIDCAGQTIRENVTSYHRSHPISA